MSSKEQVVLPPGADHFLRTRSDKRAGVIVRQFYRWMKQNSLESAQLEPWHVDRFLERPFGRGLGHRRWFDYRRQLLTYLQWLYTEGALTFDPSRLRPRDLRLRPLPELAKEFITSLTVALRPGTCEAYGTALRRFHRWATEHGVELGQLDRADVSRFLVDLKNRGLSASTKVATIWHARAYLQWLYERGWLECLADALIRPSDFPKRPKLLPRPVSPEADRELRARLGASCCRYQQGLLLMRNTGLRIGELIDLELDCLRTDLRGNSLLKVPLGKLNSERLVPVDGPTAELIRKLQHLGRPDRRWLLPSQQGRRTRPDRYRRALREACQGIHIDGRMCPHRLRHTYATTMLCGGMSLVGVMKLLGHRDYHTTLRYAAITQETIGREYFEALSNIETRYQHQLLTKSAPTSDPIQMLSDLARWIRKHIAHEQGHERIARQLTKRLKRVEDELRALLPQAGRA